MRDKIFYTICFVFILLILFSSFYIKEAPEVFEEKVGKMDSFTGLVVEAPDVREHNQKLTVSIKAEDAKVRVLVSLSFEDEFHYGDQISFKGKLEKPKNFTTDTGKEFDYINYLKKDGIYYLVNYPEITVLSHGGGSSVKRVLFAFKENFLEKINLTVPAPESLLMGGLILGEKASFSQELREQFVDTGTIHIVALSGYNITIVAEWVMRLFSFLPFTVSIYFGVFAIFLFVLMTGGASTAIRAGIMAVLALIARATSRNYDIGRALLLAGVIMIAINPMILRYDVSFQLSFIATIAVIYVSPKMEKYFQWVTKRFGLRDIVSVTFSAYVFVLPFILYKMGNLSLVALPVNILVLPLIPFTMLLGFLTGFVGLFSYFLSVPISYISYLFLHYELGVIDFLAQIPFASLTIPNFPLFLTTIIYLYFIYRLFGRNIKKFFKKGTIENLF